MGEEEPQPESQQVELWKDFLISILFPGIMINIMSNKFHSYLTLLQCPPFLITDFMSSHICSLFDICPWDLFLGAAETSKKHYYNPSMYNVQLHSRWSQNRAVNQSYNRNITGLGVFQWIYLQLAAVTHLCAQSLTPNNFYAK